MREKAAAAVSSSSSASAWALSAAAPYENRNCCALCAYKILTNKLTAIKRNEQTEKIKRKNNQIKKIYIKIIKLYKDHEK